MEENKIIKYEGGLVKRVGNAISVTNKLLAVTEPQLIPSQKEDKWGFIDTTGSMIVPLKYNQVENFEDGSHCN